MSVTEKGATGIFITLLSYVIGEFNILTAVMLIIILSDFGTGSLRVWFNKEQYSAEIAYRGVVKKFLYIFLWFLGVIMQVVLREVGPTIGITVTAPVITLMITAWIIGTELSSIVDNLNKMGVKTHKIFGRLAKKLSEIDEQGGQDEDSQ